MFAEPLFGISKGGGNTGSGPPGLGEERVPARHRGQPECTEELLRARAGSGPARPTAGAFGPGLHGDADFCPRGGATPVPAELWGELVAELLAWGGVTSRGGGGKEAVGTGPRGEGRGCSVGLGLWGGEGIVG